MVVGHSVKLMLAALSFVFLFEPVSAQEENAQSAVSAGADTLGEPAIQEPSDKLRSEAATLRAELEQARAEISERQGLIEQLRREHEALEVRRREKTEELALLNSEFLDRQNKLGQFQKRAEAEMQKLESQKQDLQQQVSELAALQSAAHLDLESVGANKDSLVIEIEALQTDLKVARAEYVDVQDRLDRASQQLVAANLDLLAAEKMASEMAFEASAAASSVGETRAQLAAEERLKREVLLDLELEQVKAEDTLAAVYSRIEGAKAELEELKASMQTVPAPAPEIPPVPSSEPAAYEASKPASLVASALRQAPGLEVLRSEDLAKLQTVLQEGMCVHEALETVMDVINRQTLLSLVRSLGRC